jgi:steroid 5-alpha reductase family enzyme
MSLLWIVSVRLKNVSIVDVFWGFGFVVTATFYAFNSGHFSPRITLIMLLVTFWGLRLSIYLAIRNWGKTEDFRYQKFRKDYGENRYWWISYFQTFLLQGTLMWLISAPLLGAMAVTSHENLNFLDHFGVIFWIIGFTFEVIGDQQLADFKKDPENKGKLLNKGMWRFTRHPNYFGETMIWTAYALISMAADNFLPVLGAILMVLLLIKVSGVALLESTLKKTKPGYAEYVRQTSAFIPWFPKK